MSKILSFLVPLTLIPSTAVAQITPDSSLGAENSVVESNGNRDTIKGGAIRDANLFHSFEEFNVDALREAYFNNPEGIANIFSRVTGNNISDIQGVLGVLGNANLYLINPNGILFGENARLDINGSFFATTVDSIVFGNGLEFSAVNPDAPPLLTIDIPVGLRFRDNSGDIVNQSVANGVGLAVNEGETIALIGGNVRVENGGIVFAPGGRIELGGLQETGTIQIAEDSSLSFPDAVVRGDISVTDSAIISVLSGEGGGSISVNGKNFNLTNGSRFIGSIRDEQGSAEAQAGDIIVNATESIVIDGQDNLDTSTGIFTNVGSNAVGNAGNIELNTNSLTVRNEAFLTANTLGEGNAGNIELNASFISFNKGTGLSASNFGRGKAGNVTINATDDISFANDSQIFVTGNEGGSININAKNLSITSGSVFFGGINIDSGFPNAQSGDIKIDLTEDLVIDGLDSQDGTFINNVGFGEGNPGNIDINARNITFKNGGNIGILINPEQENVNIGNISLNATGNITFDGIKSPQISGISNFLPENISGNIGKLNITAQNLALTNGAQIQSIIAGVADSGDININVANSVIIDGFSEVYTENKSGVVPSQISSLVAKTGQGNTGNININAQNIALSRNGFISNSIEGKGNAGNLNIDAEQITIGEPGNINLLPSYISADQLQQEGNGGDITINTGSLLIKDGGDISADVFGERGNGGNITINARDIVSVDGTGIFLNPKTRQTGVVFSGITTDVVNSAGNGGSIEINTTKLIVNNNAFISSDVINSVGNAGDIIIKATDSIEVLGEGSIAVAVLLDSTGKGGNLTIETGKLTVSEGSQISASTFGKGNAGNLTIRATDSIELTGSNNTGRSGLFAGALEEDGNGGNLDIFTQDLIIKDGATISVGNFPTIEGLRIPGTGEAGSLAIEARNITLENGGRITAATQAGENGNITLAVTEDIILRDNSLISAQAFKNATGGNLDIDARFIIAFPNQNNDIIASAAQGDGGNIDITAESVFGLEERSSTPANTTNDIDASSQFGLNGNISVNTPVVDPTSGLLELTIEVVDASQLIAQNVCNQTANSEFMNIGKGGLAKNPDDVLAEEAIEVELVTPVPVSSAEIEDKKELEAVKPKTTRKPPVQGWIFQENGTVELVAYNPSQTGDRPSWGNSRSCQ